MQTEDILCITYLESRLVNEIIIKVHCIALLVWKCVVK